MRICRAAFDNKMSKATFATPQDTEGTTRNKGSTAGLLAYGSSY